MPSRISKPLRASVRARAADRCEYCQSAEVFCGYVFEVDHILPAIAGGQTADVNLALACSSCNGHKAARVEALDPESNRSVLIFNPRSDMWADHFRWSGDGTQVIGRIDTGRASVDALRMNNPAIVFARAFWVKYGLHPPKLQSEA